MSTQDKQLTLSQAAKLLKVSEKSIRRYIKAGRLSASLGSGTRGPEYRISKSAVESLRLPERGRKPNSKIIKKPKSLEASPSSQTLRRSSIENLDKNSAKKTEPTSPQNQSISSFSSIRDIIEEKPSSAIQSIREKDLIDYRTLYENLLVRYEQTLIMIGSLEAQITSIPQKYRAEIEHLKDTISRQEELVIELYQAMKEKENNS